MGKRLVLVVVGLTLAQLSLAQAILAGYHEYPQFRTMIALPGSAFPISPDGHVNWHGAMSLSTPVAYGLAQGVWVGGLSSTSNSMKLHFPREKGSDLVKGNGSGQVLVGIDLGSAGRLTPGMLVLSGEGDTAFNFQYSAPKIGKNLYLAAGVVDLSGGGGSSGAGQPGDADNSTSFYAVATMPFDQYGAHLSVGGGSKRYSGVFANGSIDLIPMVKGYVEYDTFNVNSGIAWLIRTPQPDENLVFQMGVVKGKYLNATFNFSF